MHITAILKGGPEGKWKIKVFPGAIKEPRVYCLYTLYAGRNCLKWKQAVDFWADRWLYWSVRILKWPQLEAWRQGSLRNRFVDESWQRNQTMYWYLCLVLMFTLNILECSERFWTIWWMGLLVQGISVSFWLQPPWCLHSGPMDEANLEAEMGSLSLSWNWLLSLLNS